MKRTQISRRPSKAKRDFDAEYASLLPGVLARGCEWAAYAHPSVANGFSFTLDDVICNGRLVGHHAKGRRARDANEYLICLCDHHHTFVHANPRWAREVGLMLSRIS